MLTRLLEPLSTRLERRDRGAAVLHVAAAPRHPPSAATRTRAVWSCRRRCATCARCARWRCSISNRTRRRRPSIASRVSIDPTPGRVLQHALFTRAQPDARAAVDAARAARRADGPGPLRRRRARRSTLSPRRVRDEAVCGRRMTRQSAPRSAEIAENVPYGTLRTPRISALNAGVVCVSAAAASRCRRAWSSSDGRPVRVTTDRRGFAGGAVVHAPDRGGRRDVVGSGAERGAWPRTRDPTCRRSLESRRVGRGAQRWRRIVSDLPSAISDRTDAIADWF